MPDDQIFTGRASRFKDRIYGSTKGELRLKLLWRDMQENLPLQAGPLDVWDAGGGLGQISQLLAAQGHHVLLSEPAEDMLELARENLPASVECRQETLQQHIASGAAGAGYDLIVCHAVLEWLAQPAEALPLLERVLRPGGWLSLLFYNVNAIALANIVKGNLYKVRDRKFAGEQGGFTPPSPQDPQVVARQLDSLGLHVVNRRSLRFVHDLMPKAVRAERSLEDIMEVEWMYGDNEPYWQLGRYVHLVCRKS